MRGGRMSEIVETKVTTVRQIQCRQCSRVLPAVEFRFRASEVLPATQFADVCHDCRDAIATRDEAIRRDRLHQISDEKRKSEVLKAAAVLLHDSENGSPHTCELAAEFYRQFGGVQKFVAVYMTQLKVLLAEKPGTRLTMESLWRIVKLTAEASRQRGDAPDVRDLTDDDLEEMLSRHMAGKGLTVTSSSTPSSLPSPAAAPVGNGDQGENAVQDEDTAVPEVSSDGG